MCFFSFVGPRHKGSVGFSIPSVYKAGPPSESKAGTEVTAWLLCRTPIGEDAL